MNKSLLFSAKSLTASCLLLILSGCAETSLVKWKQHAHPLANAQNPVVRVLCLWEPASGNDPDGIPTRGFAGQILFFTGQSPAPAEVNGDVRIYLFDDQGSPEEQAKPIHQFDFSCDAWKTHLQESTLGPAYQVFIPYVRKGYRQAVCALRVRYKPVDGPVIFSDMASVTLMGKTQEPADKPTDSSSKKSTEQSIVQTSATAPAGQAAGSRVGQSAGNPAIDRLVEQALAKRAVMRATKQQEQQPQAADSNQQENPPTSEQGPADHAATDARSEATAPSSVSASRRAFKSYTIRVPR